MKKILSLSFIICVFFINSCIPEYNNKYQIENLPNSYSSDKNIDTSNISNIEWSEFFKDTNLIELINYGLEYNTDIKLILQKLEISKNELKYKENLLYPQVGVIGSFSNKRFGKYTMESAGNTGVEIEKGVKIPEFLNDFSAGILSSWEIDLWGKFKNSEKAALNRFLATKEAINLIQSNFIAEIAINYFELLALDNQLDVIKKNILILNEALEIIIVQKSASMVNELSVKRFEAEVLNYKALEYEKIQQISLLENKINYLLGRYNSEIKRDKSKFNSILDLKINQGIPNELLKNRPDIRKSSFELIANELDIKSAEASFYPNLSLNLNLGLQSYNPTLLIDAPQSIAYNLLSNLSAPIFNRNLIELNYKNIKANQIESLINYQKTLINAFTEVNNQIVSFKNYDKIFELKNKEVNILMESISISNELFKVGKATYFELLMTQHNLFIAQIESIDSKKLQFQSVINLYKALGGGWK
jgi:multidrug efflux system outer membrane protein